ncbi:hypothetical protein FNV43_RR10845 [Rhamnella rubrinervis]|uniref:DEK-C domain-containing protein n=1 Tax=Rhamnella rubrinervis TaxID=2594499 RepID=A0A8K0MGQ0_9ROSA|nr:hypothetical protein FNV43_RR10845 [Rhamnella rubrinervis]
MAELDAQDSETPQKDVKEEAQDIESQVKAAMRSRVAHFKEQADSLTFEGVRRLLEKDLGMGMYTLDVHKRLIKQLLVKCLEGANDENDSKNSEEVRENSVGEKAADSSEEHEPKKDVKESLSEDEDKMEDSPVLGLLTGHRTTKSETEGNVKKKPLSESLIKTALKKRESYITANSDKVTMAVLRRLLEEDLELDKFDLDPYKKFITQQVDNVLKSSEVSEPASNVKKKFMKNSQKTVSKEVSIEESSDSSDNESDEEEDEPKPKKKSVPKGKVQNSDGLKKRKNPGKDMNISGKKRIKPAETVTKSHSDAEDSGSASEDGQSQSSAEKTIKKREVSTPAYGKRVESLKSVIKACGMSVPPVVYKKVKQVPENKREAQLIKELEEILAKEGLSANPTEKEIKETRKKKERAKELEGIDTSNIVMSSRRRSTTSFVPPPPKPKIPVESDGDDGEDTDDNDDDEDDDDNDDEEEEDNGNSDDSQSEESNEDDDDSD